MRLSLPLTSTVCVLLLLFLQQQPAVAADPPPYAGSWRMNVAKSQYPESTMTFDHLPEGRIRVTLDGRESYIFEMKGSEVTTPSGLTVVWMQLDNHTWQLSQKTGDRLHSVVLLKLARDRKGILRQTTVYQSNGKSDSYKEPFFRDAATPGLFGDWTSRRKGNVTAPKDPEILTLQPHTSAGVTLSLKKSDAQCDARFDGKQYPVTGSWPKGFTCRISPAGSRALTVSWFKDGVETYRATLDVSDDGKTLIESGSDPAVPGKARIIYEKQ